MARFHRTLLAIALTGCGGGGAGFSPPPINLSVSVNGATITVPPTNTAVLVPVTIVAPTETATFSLTGLPAGVSYTYKESESNPSGLLTLVAITTTVPGTYMPTITVGSSGQTASVVFTLVISAPVKHGVFASASAHPLKPTERLNGQPIIVLASWVGRLAHEPLPPQAI